MLEGVLKFGGGGGEWEREGGGGRKEDSVRKDAKYDQDLLLYCIYVLRIKFCYLFSFFSFPPKECTVLNNQKERQ